MDSSLHQNECLRITLENLCIKAIIGILPKERIHPQKLIINGTFDYFYVPNNFLDYRKLRLNLTDTLYNGKFFLLEEALLALKEKICKDFTNIQSFSITLTKPNIFSNCAVSLTMNFKL